MSDSKNYKDKGGRVPDRMSRQVPEQLVPVVPMIPLRDVVIMPSCNHELYVGRAPSVAALERSLASNTHELIFITQRDEFKDNPAKADLYDWGCLARIESFSRTDDFIRVEVLGLERIAVRWIEQDPASGMQQCAYEVHPTAGEPAPKAARRLIAKLAAKLPDDEAKLLGMIEQAGVAADMVAAHLRMPIKDQQSFLEIIEVPERIGFLERHFARESEIQGIEKRMRREVEKQTRQHRQDYLEDRASSIERQLGESGAGDESEELRRKVRAAGMSEEAADKCLQEIGRLATTSPLSPESSVIRSYLDVLLGLPWQERSKLQTDLVHARKILDDDHCGLAKAKERIIEHLAVQQLPQSSKSGTVMCFIGPPGVGKTSLGRSIARATGRRFVRLSLGGIHDEATIRGHRRTYVASMPGRILKAMADAKVKNPVFMLDEIEKLDASHSGDPMAAMLEVIDPEQNHAFSDHYIEVDFDLSEVMFIATANSSDRMYGALADRMEFIELHGYTDLEKADIARNYLIPKQRKAHGLAAAEAGFSKEAIADIIASYTNECGVRGLERNIAKALRKMVLKREQGKARARTPRLSKTKLRQLLGVPLQHNQLKREDQVGIVNGLALKGDSQGIVHQIDALKIEGGKQVEKTGNLKPHIQQAIDTAVTVLRANHRRFGVAPDFTERYGVHIHYPNIDVIHDGNSNGLAIFTLLVSVLTDVPVRMDTALTGAINLRGEACAIGGLRAKLIGAWRQGIKRILIPQIQLREVVEVPKEILAAIEVVPIRNVTEVIANCLTSVPAPYVEEPAAAEKEVLVGKKGAPAVTRH